MGKPEKKPVQESVDDAQIAAYEDSLPKCHDQKDFIICDWGKDESDPASAHPIISTLLPGRLTVPLLGY